MRNTIFILIALLTIISCKNTSYIEEITSERNVGITLRKYYDDEKDTVITTYGIVIPVEFKLDINYLFIISEMKKMLEAMGIIIVYSMEIPIFLFFMKKITGATLIFQTQYI